MPPSPMTAGIYARVSSEQQAESGTIASQVEALLQRAADDGVEIEASMRFVDDGYSGATLVRPALERLRDVVYAGALDRVYVYCADRLARKYAYQVLVVEEFQRHGVELVFLDHGGGGVGQSPEDNLLLQVQGMVAEYERAKILERSRRGKRHAAQRGSINVLGGAPYGYRYVGKHEAGGEAHYDVVFSEAQVVRQIFQWVGQDRISIAEVCRRLEKQGIRTRSGKPWWDRTTVWAMLKNPAYMGQAAFGKTRSIPFTPPLRPQRGRHAIPRRGCSTRDLPEEQWICIPVPAIVSAELFEAVGQQLQENRRRARTSRRGARHLLQGLVVCAQCGYAYYGKKVSKKAAKGKTRPYAYYRCVGADAYRFGGHRVCHNKQVRTDRLEEAVWEDVRTMLADPRRVEQEYQRRLSAPTTTEHTGPSPQAQLQKNRRAIGRIMDAYEGGWLDKAEFEQRMKAARQRQDQLQDQIRTQADRETQRRELRLVLARLHDFAAQVEHGLADPDWSTRRDIMRALIKEVQIGDESVRIVYRVDPIPFDQAPDNGGGLQHCWRRDLAASLERVPALCAGSMVRAGGSAASASPGVPDPLCGRLLPRVPR